MGSHSKAKRARRSIQGRQARSIPDGDPTARQPRARHRSGGLADLPPPHSIHTWQPHPDHRLIRKQLRTKPSHRKQRTGLLRPRPPSLHHITPSKDTTLRRVIVAYSQPAEMGPPQQQHRHRRPSQGRQQPPHSKHGPSQKKKHPSIKNQIRSVQRRLQKAQQVRL